MPKIIGLTGQSGAGKTTVCDWFAKSGFAVINADLVARQVVQPGADGLKRLTEIFGEQILTEHGEMNRKLVADIVFHDEVQLERLNKTILPYITKEIDRIIDKMVLEGKEYILLDAPTLYESGADAICNTVVAVVADPEIRLQRILRRDDMTFAAATARNQAQKPDEFYRQRADVVFENNGTLQELKVKIQPVIDRLMQK